MSAFASVTEVAWTPELAATAVQWFGANGYAVLGTELWLIKGGAIQSLPVGLSGMREVHGNTIDRGSQEPWSAFVIRAAAETVVYLQPYDAADIVESGDVNFNVVWIGESEYGKLMPS